ncbi:MAG: sialidase family protein, partial [Gemmatimonadota bacterium]
MPDPRPEPLLTIEPTPQAPRNSEGAIVRRQDGSLCLAYSRFTGGGHNNSRAQIARRLSPDGGQTWTADEIVVDTEGAENVMSVSLLRLAAGAIVLFYAVKNGWGDCRLYGRRSTDELTTLGERFCATPQDGYHVVNNDRVVQLSSGRLVVPAALHPCPGGTRETWSPRGISMCFLSDDGGVTWRRSTTELHAPEGSKTGLQEPGVVELRDGRLRLWTRTDLGCQYESISADGGDTWSPAAPGPLASPVSPASIRRLPWTGDLFAVWNDHSGRHPFPAGRRTPLCVATSADEGRSWRPSKV